MLVIENTIISEDLVDNYFACNLQKCKGACCVAGEFGAPLEDEELEHLHSNLREILPFLSDEGVRSIDKNGTSTLSSEGKRATPLTQNGECAYAYREKDGCRKCGIERAFELGKIDWSKPISCHLYPVRITKHKNFEAINYHKWEICKEACKLGEKLGTPVYAFVKDALVRRYGQKWYDELVIQIGSLKK